MSCAAVSAVRGDAGVRRRSLARRAGALRVLCVWPLLFVGDISYSLYLVHEVIGQWVIFRLRASGMNVNLAELCAMALAIALGAGVRYAVELPAQRAVRGLWRRLGGATHATERPALV